MTRFGSSRGFGSTSGRVTIPVRVHQTPRSETQEDKAQTSAAQADQNQSGGEQFSDQQPETVEPGGASRATPERHQPSESPLEQVTSDKEGREDGQDWRDRALRLQAEMENYRKRQQRLAQEQIEVERERLLTAFLRVIDDLERALEAPGTGDQGLRQGVELTRRAALQALDREGVKPIQALNQPFDPLWHEAVATVGRDGADLPPNTVAKVVAPGYRLGDRLLRPAKVVVAV